MKIFVSMGFRGKSEEDVKEILNRLKKAYCRMYPEMDESEIELECNFWYSAQLKVNVVMYQTAVNLNSISGKKVMKKLMTYFAKDYIL